MGTLSSPRRLLAICAMTLGAFGALASIGAPIAGAADGCARNGCIDVVAVDGLIDSIEADFIIDTLRTVNAQSDVVAVVLQLDSAGSAVSDSRLDEVARAIAESRVPVSVWIGPSGSIALGGAAELAQVADSSGIAPGSDIGDVGAQRLSIAEFGRLFRGESLAALDRSFSGEAAVEAGLVDRFSPTIGSHIISLDGVETRVTEDNGEVPVAVVRFSKLPLHTQLFHTVASPSVAYLLLVIGLGLLLFEFFTAGVGVAGVVGAGFVILGGYGIAALPFNGWALALVLLSMIGFAVDMQTGIPRAWTAISMVAFTVGSLFVLVEFRPTWLALAAGVIAAAATVFSGMPAMIRTRFATPTIGREWMIGEMGTASTAVDPDGVVSIRDAPWRARTNRATPIEAGDPVRVVAIDGLVLEIEPEEGAAVDHREMRKGSQ